MPAPAPAPSSLVTCPRGGASWATRPATILPALIAPATGLPHERRIAMNGGSIVALIVLVAAFALLVVEAAAEAGVISLSRSRARLLLEREPDDPTAQRLHRIIQARERALGSFAVGRTLAVTTGVTAAVYLIAQELGFSWEAVIATGAVAFLVAGVAQAVPRRLAGTSPEAFGLLAARTMDALDSLFVIPALVMEAPAFSITRFRAAQAAHAPEPTELEVLLEQNDGGGIEADEREMIRRVIEIGETPVHEAAVPRPDIVAVDVESALRDAAQIAVDRGVSRVAVFEGSLDNVIGILYAKDALAELLANRDTAVRDLMRPPLLVPESKLIDDLLTEFRTKRVHIAIVLDEYGGTAGLVTIEDLLEEIVGEIEDEYDHSSADSVVRISDDEAILDGRTSTDSLDELFGYKLEGVDFATVGGLMFDRLGKIPEVGDEVHVDGLHLAVLRMDGRRIARVRVRRDATESGSRSDEPVTAP